MRLITALFTLLPFLSLSQTVEDSADRIDFLLPLAPLTIETDRPDFTESPNVVPFGAWQIETGFVLEKSTEDHCLAEYRTNTTLNTTLIRYGIGTGTELRLNWSVDRSSIKAVEERVHIAPCLQTGEFESDTSFTRTGLAPVFLGIKQNLISTDRLSIGFLAHIYLPYGSEHLKAERYAPEYLLPISVGVTDRFSVSIQPGMSWDGFEVEPTGWITLSLGYSVSDRVGAYLEPFSYRDGNAVSNRINGGFTFLFNDHFQWDASAGLWDKRAENRHLNYFVSTGLSFLFL